MDTVKQSIYYTVAKICESEGKDTNFRVTPDGIACLCEVILQYSEIFAKDLEAFAAHAKRSTVAPADVRLVARKQPQIISKLDDIISVLDEQKKKRRKKADPSS